MLKTLNAIFRASRGRIVDVPRRLALVCLVLCGAPEVPMAAGAVPLEIQGTTMGTTYSVKWMPAARAPTANELQRAIARRLARLDTEMSTYRADSALSRFNRNPSSGWLLVPDTLWRVVAAAHQVSRDTDGAFDVTVGPLVDLWGFGPLPGRTEPPSSDAIAAARQKVNFRWLHSRTQPSALRKARADLSVDLSAIGKGYAVDVIAHYLTRHGISHYLVEIGGELRAHGHPPDATGWRIALAVPTAPDQVSPRVRLRDAAIATSGNYRNFFDHAGVRYSHEIDPRTGWPIAHALVAVSVVQPTAMLADAYATGLLVLGPQAGPARADALKLAALFVVRDGSSFRLLPSSVFARQYGGVEGVLPRNSDRLEFTQ